MCGYADGVMDSESDGEISKPSSNSDKFVTITYAEIPFRKVRIQTFHDNINSKWDNACHPSLTISL